MRVFKAVLLCIFLAFGSCKREQSPVSADPPPRTFTVKGILRSIDLAGQSATIEHEDIPNYMPSMAMPFDLKSMAEIQSFKVGDPIEFKLRVTAESSWIEDLRKISTEEVQLPAKRDAPTTSARETERLKEGDGLPEFNLLDSKGRPVTRETFSGHPLVITFIFTRCPVPNFCPLMTSNFREIQRTVKESPKPGDARLLSISFDPEYDTPDVLARYAAAQTADADQWRFTTGSAPEVAELTRAFGVSIQSEGGGLNHTLTTALIDRKGVIRKIWRGNGWKPAEVIEALRSLPPSH